MYPYIQLFGRAIPSYGLCMAAGILLSSYIAAAGAKRQRLDINSLIVIAACAVGMGLFGAKIFYLFASCNIEAVLARMLKGDISDLTSGGQVFYGGLIGGVAGALIGGIIAGEKERFSEYCNVLALSIPLGHAIGRVGCFLGGCCYGVPYTGICAVTFPKAGVIEPVFPVQLLEAALDIGIFFLLHKAGEKMRQGFRLLYMYLVMYSAVRFMLEFLRGDEIRGIQQGLSTSQWVSIGLFVCGTILLLADARRKRPG